MSVSTPHSHPPRGIAPAARTGVEPHLGHLRKHLIHNRARRGPCPAFTQLKAAFLPAPQPLGTLERDRTHVRLCLVCSSRLRAWKRSWRFPADQSLAWSRLATHLTRRHGGRVARGLSDWIGRAVPAMPAAVPSTGQGRARAQSAPRARHTRGPRQRPLRLVVVEAGPGLPPATILARHVDALGGALAVVPRIEEALGDRDWKHVRTVLLARPRPFGEWRGLLDRLEEGKRSPRAFALLPPQVGPVPLPARDARVVAGPLSENRWAALLAQSGWFRPES